MTSKLRITNYKLRIAGSISVIRNSSFVIVLLVASFFILHASCFILSANAQSISGVINTYRHVVLLDTCLNTATIPSTSGFSAGDRVLIIQMKGARIDESNTASYGTVTSMNGAGLFEIATVLSVPSLTTLRFRDKILNYYDIQNGFVQLVRIPQYTDVTVSGTLSPQPWNPGSGTGGVLILEASGTLTLDAPVDASGMGYSGGSASSNGGGDSVSDYAFDGYSGALAGDGGYKGEGIASNLGIYVSIDVAGRGPAANGGGGGDAHNSGGGGGSNAKSGGKGGDQTDAPGFGRFPNGGAPGITLAAGALPTIFMGGGGGGGEQNDNFGTNGANGGGIIIIRAPKIVSAFDTIRANGASPVGLAKSDGAGGGGAGGTIIIDVDSVFLPNQTKGAIWLQIKGGDGGSVSAESGPYGFGPGGGGAGGLYARIGNAWGTWFMDQNGGKAGLVTNCTNLAINNTSYGATDGAFGSNLNIAIPESTVPYNYPAGASIHLSSICKGELDTISASGADYYLWTPSVGLKDSTDAQISVSPDTTTVYTVQMTKGRCVFTDTVHVAVLPLPNAAFTGPDTVCNGSTVTYSVVNPPIVSTKWQVTGGTAIYPSPDTLAVTWNATGVQTITLQASSGTCTSSSSRQIVVGNQVAPQIAGDTALCSGGSTTLGTTSNYLTYLWHPNSETTRTITVSKAGTYSVDVTSAGGCSGSSNALQVVVNQLPAIPSITRVGMSLVSSYAASYSWSFNGSAIPEDTETINPILDGSYTVTITDSNGCSSTSLPFNFVRFGTAYVSVPALSRGDPGSIVSIPVTLDSANGLAESGATNYFAQIILDGTMLTPVSPSGVLKGGNWTVTITGLTPAATGLLQNITVMPLDSGHCSNVLIDTFYFPGSTTKVTTENGAFCLTGTCRPWLKSSDSAFTIKQISPNPSDGLFTIEYHIASEGPLTLLLEDYLGRTAKVLKNQWSAPGDANETYSIDYMPSGVYRLLLRSGYRVLIAMLVVAR